MDRPVFWSVLVAVTVVVMALRLAARRPLWPQRARGVPAREVAMAGLMVAILVFHCAAMFFAEWVDRVPLADRAASAVRDLGLLSQVAYWVPAIGLVIALRRVWLPALGLLAVTLVGVGFTMFVPHHLTVHLAWISATAVTLVTVAAALVVPVRPAAPGAG